MSRNINVNPGHYKVAGRERQGEAIHQSSQKGAYAQQLKEVRRGAMEAQAGLPAWETTPPNLEIPDKETARKTRTRKTRKKARTGTRSLRKKATARTPMPRTAPGRKAAPKRKAAAKRSAAPATRRRAR